MLTEGVVDANGPGHALLTLNSGEHLSRVLESHWSFAQGVTDGKEVNKTRVVVSKGPRYSAPWMNIQDNRPNICPTVIGVVQ